AVDQVDERKPVLVCQIFHEAAAAALAPVVAGRYAAPHGVVLAANGDRPSADFRQAHYVRRGRDVYELVVGGISRLAGELADFAERFRIGDFVDPLADRQASAFVMTRN